MLIAGQLMLPDESGNRALRLSPGWLSIDETSGRILALGPSNTCPSRTPDLGGPSSLISPGFIDTHLHLPQFDSIGADGLELLPWLECSIFPAEAKWVDADYAGHMTTRISHKLLANGTTSIAAYATVHHDATQHAITALAAAGLTGIVGQVLMDQHAPAELLRPASQLLREASQVRSHGRIRHAITPRFAITCSDELLRGAGLLATATKAFVQTHLSETQDECSAVRTLHNEGYVEVYRRAGLLGPRTLLGHGIWLDDAERHIIHQSGAIIAHCPTANLFLQAGLMNLRAHERAGVRISLGSDVAGGPEIAMPRVARAMIETAKLHRMSRNESASIPSAAHAWWQITTGNADALGLPAGRLAISAPADLVIFNPSANSAASAPWQTAVDPFGALLYTWDPRWITHTFAAGRIVYQS